ncbi:MAG: hypothetical protein ACLQVX_00500 [Limisphaerales bacterium]
MAHTSDLVDFGGDLSTNVFASDGTLTMTGQRFGQGWTGSYTFTRYSPVGGLLTIDFTSPTEIVGSVSYSIITYSASKAGSWFTTFIPFGGGTQDTDYGTFTVQ